MKIIIDAMGGDFAPEAPVRGALLAREKYGADIILTGRTADILRELEKAGCKEVLWREAGGFELIRRAETPRDYFATLDVDPAWETLRARWLK